MKILGRIGLFLIIALLAAGPTLGQDEPAPQKTRSVLSYPFGIRAGYTNWKNLDQFHAGAHVYLGELWPNVEFTPNVELGFGSDAFVMTVNGDLTYLFTEFVRYPWGLYGGGSLAFNLIDPKVGDSETHIGFSVVLGTTYTFANDHKGMAEIKTGLVDSPDFKLTFGYTLF